MITEPLTVWLIHGTWAKNAEWAIPSNALQTALRRSINGVKIEVFQWSSWNRFSARHDGAKELAAKLQSTPGRHFIIAHSHGGNLAREAIRENEDRIGGLICLNTPFFTVLGRESYYLLNTVVAFIGVTLLWTIFGLWSSYDWHWLPTVGLWLVTFGIMGACFSSVGGPSWTRNRERYLREQLEPPALRTTRVLCLTTTEDEAYSWLSFLEGVANLPFLLMARWLFAPIWFFGLVLLSTDVLPVLSAPWELWTGAQAAGVDDWRRWVHFIGSSFFFPALFHFMGIGLAALSSLVLVALPYGHWKFPEANFFVRVIVSLTPIGCRSIEFREFDPETAGLRHSVLYQDTKALDLIVEWIQAICRPEVTAQHSLAGGRAASGNIGVRSKFSLILAKYVI